MAASVNYFSALRCLRSAAFSGAGGQTTIEYLMLLAAAAAVAFILVQGPMAGFADSMVTQIRSALGNVVQNGELTPGKTLQTGDSGHPGDRARAKALHL